MYCHSSHKYACSCSAVYFNISCCRLKMTYITMRHHLLWSVVKLPHKQQALTYLFELVGLGHGVDRAQRLQEKYKLLIAHILHYSLQTWKVPVFYPSLLTNVLNYFHSAVGIFSVFVPLSLPTAFKSNFWTSWSIKLKVFAVIIVTSILCSIYFDNRLNYRVIDICRTWVWLKAMVSCLTTPHSKWTPSQHSFLMYYRQTCNFIM